MKNDNKNMIDSKTYEAIIYNCDKNKNLRKYFIDPNLINIPVALEDMIVNGIKEFNSNQLINLYNEIIGVQNYFLDNTLFTPGDEYYISKNYTLISTLTFADAKKLTEEELERKGVKINFEFYYNNYKNNLKKEGSKYAKY